MDTTDQLTGRPATELAALVHAGEVTPAEVVAAHLARIGALDARLGAWQLVRAEQAMAEAEALGRRPAGELAALPLAGVPVAVKDNADLAGHPTRRGTAGTPDRPAEADSEPVRRLKAAGAIVVGKTRMPELGLWHFTESASWGPTRNPWDPSRSPGGSSGGSAAAVAAGMVPVALANDGLGSIRIPAAWCGLVGIKPGNGVVPSGAPEHWFGLTVTGPVATTVADAALVFDLFAGRAPSLPVPEPAGRLRLRLSTTVPAAGVGADQAVLDALADAGAALAEAGHTVTKGDPPYRRSLAIAIFQRWFQGVADDIDTVIVDPSKLEPRTRAMAAIGRQVRHLRPVTPAAAQGWRAEMARAFDGVDAFLMPTVARQAPKVGAADGAGFARTMAAGVRLAPFAAAWNLAGLPALSVPAGLDADGLPLAVQLLGPAGSEATLIGLAAQLERLRPWPRLAPDLARPSDARPGVRG